MTFWVLMFWQRFQHTAARRRLPEFKASFIGGLEFQHTAARRRLPNIPVAPARFELFQHTAARRRLHVECGACFVAHVVSTHSRPKAAARLVALPQLKQWFQHTAARRRLRKRVTFLRSGR